MDEFGTAVDELSFFLLLLSDESWFIVVDKCFDEVLVVVVDVVVFGFAFDLKREKSVDVSNR